MIELVALVVGYLIVMIAARCFTEWLMARFLDVGKWHDKLIILTNLITGTILCFFTPLPALMIIPFFDSLSPYKYLLLLAVIEIPASICKYFIYRRKMFERTTKECLGYTAAASAASLIICALVTALWVQLLKSL